jgi:hypothetical protein
MLLSPRTVRRVTLAAALVVFCGVQDRVTAAGARRYVAAQREAMSAGTAPVTVDSVMRPAVTRSVQQALLWAAATAAAGFGVAFTLRRGSRE